MPPFDDSGPLHPSTQDELASLVPGYLSTELDPESERCRLLFHSPDGTSILLLDCSYEVRQRCLIEALNQLNQRERILVTLDRWEGMKLDQIAYAMGIQTSAVIRIQESAVQHLKAILLNHA